MTSSDDQSDDQSDDARRDFGRLWGAYAVSAAGSAIGTGALPLVAVLALEVTAFQVSLLAALSALAAVAITLPLGGRVERCRKRPVMIAADLLRCLVLLSVPVAAALGVLTFAHLCLVGVVQAAAGIVFGAASAAHLKGLVPPGDRLRAASRFETTSWLSLSAGPPLGGLLVTAFGTTVTLAVDAFSFLLSALGVRLIRRPEPEPPARAGSPGRGRDLMAGWAYVLGHRGLRPLFWNAMLFGGAIMMGSPLLIVLMLRELHFTPWQYGLALGLPCLGGALGSRLTAPLTRRLGPHRVLLLFGVLRTPWLLLLVWVPHGPLGPVVMITADTFLLLAAGVFNPSFTTYRMAATDDGVMTRVVTAWSVGSKTAQPLSMLVGGAVAAVGGVRAAILVAGVLCVASALLLPWRALPSAAGGPGRAGVREGSGPAGRPAST
ncbi:MFS transporter [Actinacidiphila glaucinigra]|uniref:MFS transporter n=1 Tax=Actinacidiphila glaucinigra TaxID=235986 RepID=UPI0033F7D47B